MDYKALTGDTSDNIPGVSGVGRKRPPRSCRSMARWTTSTPTSPRSSRRAFAQRWRQGREVGLYEPRTWSPSSATWRSRSTCAPAPGAALIATRVMALLRELGFTLAAEPHPAAPAAKRPSNWASLQDQAPAAAQPRPAGRLSHRADTTRRLIALVTRSRRRAVLALDTETTSTDAMRSRLVGISLSASDGRGLLHPRGPRSSASATSAATALETVRDTLAPVLADERPRQGAAQRQVRPDGAGRHGMPVAAALL